MGDFLLFKYHYLHNKIPLNGDEGGYIVTEGTPEEVAQVPQSYTGQYLKKMLR